MGIWDELNAATAVAPGCMATLRSRAHFAWRHYTNLLKSFKNESDGKSQIREALVQDSTIDAQTGGIMALLAMALDNNAAMPKAIPMLQKAVLASPGDDGLLLRLAIALDGSAPVGEAMKVLEKRISVKDHAGVDPRLLAAYAFIAATKTSDQKSQRYVTSALDVASTRVGTIGGATASIYRASMSGQVPFEEADKLYKLLRDMIFNPSLCHKRLEIAVLFRRHASVKEGVRAGDAMLKGFTFECPYLSSSMSSMGAHWVDSADTTKAGLGGDQGAVAGIRQGLRDLQYSDLWQLLQDGGTPDESNGGLHLEMLHAAEHSKYLPKAEDIAADRCAPKQLPEIARPPVQDKVGCPHVKPKGFAKCVKQQRPCIMRNQAKAFLKGGLETGDLDVWAKLAGDAPARVSFVFPPSIENGSATLNLIEETDRFFKRPDIVEDMAKKNLSAPDAEKLPWTLARGPQWHMRFGDVVHWLRSHPSPIYMNQLMLNDLGNEVLSNLRPYPDWVTAANFTLAGACIWASSGMATTGYHTDAPENLVVQLSGKKEFVLARPSELKNLYYREAVDVLPHAMHRGPKDHEIVFKGLKVPNRTSDTHSIIDIANPEAASRFPRYAKASGVSCHIDPGDVLYVPSFWHHAVLSKPGGSQCTSTMVNLWNVHPNKVQSRDEAIRKAGGTEADTKVGEDDWV